MQRTNSLEKTLMLGKTEGRRRRGQQRMRRLNGITDSMDINLGKLWEIVADWSLACCSPQDCKKDLATEQQHGSHQMVLTYICETLMILDYLGVSVLLCISTAQIESYYYQYNILCICSKIEIPAWTVFPFGHSY